jgi:hypothetical protein
VRHTGDRVRNPGCESIEQPDEEHAVHRRAHRPRCEVDISFGPIADAVTKYSPAALSQRLTFLIQEEQQ